MASVKQVEAAVESEVKAVVNVVVHAAVAALVSYAVARVSGAHNAVLDALWATPPVAGVVAYLRRRFGA